MRDEIRARLRQNMVSSAGSLVQVFVLEGFVSFLEQGVDTKTNGSLNSCIIFFVRSRQCEMANFHVGHIDMLVVGCLALAFVLAGVICEADLATVHGQFAARTMRRRVIALERFATNDLMTFVIEAYAASEVRRIRWIGCGQLEIKEKLVSLSMTHIVGWMIKSLICSLLLRISFSIRRRVGITCHAVSPPQQCLLLGANARGDLLVRNNPHIARGISYCTNKLDNASDGGGAALKYELLSTPDDWHC